MLTCVVNGVLLFALEREHRTHQLLNGLPLHPRQVVWTKLLVGLLGSFAMILILGWAGGLVTYWASGSMPKTGLLVGDQAAHQSLLCMGPLAFLVIGVAAALLAGATFHAFVIAAFIASVVGLTTSYITIDRRTVNSFGWAKFGVILAIAVAATIVITLNAQRWLEGRTWRLARWRNPLLATDYNAESDRATRSSARRFPVLMWQSWKIALPKIGLWLLATLSVWLIFACGFTAEAREISLADQTLLMFWVLSITAVGMLSLFSATIFQADHQAGLYRFYQQHVERPRWFWLTRMVPWIAVATVVAALLSSGLVSLMGERFAVTAGGVVLEHDRFVHHLLENGIAYATTITLTGLAIGQFWSMFVRNFVIAIVLSLIAGGFVYYGIGWLIWMGESLAVFVLPLVLVLFLATWYRSKFWLADDRRWIGYVVPFAAIATTAGVLFASFVHHRANSISEPDVRTDNIASVLTQFPNANYTISELQFGDAASRAKTASMYRQILSHLKNDHAMGNLLGLTTIWLHDLSGVGGDEDRDKDRVEIARQRCRQAIEASPEAVKLLVTAGRQVGCDPFLDTIENGADVGNARLLRGFAMSSALVELEGGNVKKSLKAIEAYHRTFERTCFDYRSHMNRNGHYHTLLILWSELPDQTIDSLQTAIYQLEGIGTVTDAELNEVHMERYAWAKRKGPGRLSHQGLSKNHLLNYRYRGGERDWFTLLSRLQEIDATEHIVAQNVSALLSFPWERERYRRLLKWDAIGGFNARYWKIWRSDAEIETDYNPFNRQRVEHAYEIPDADRRVFSVGDRQYSFYWLGYERSTSETLRRYTLVRFALQAHRIEHGGYPQRLAELAKYFRGDIPETTQLRQNFGWFSDGVPANVFQDVQYAPDIEITPNRPVLFPFAVKRPVDLSKQEDFEIQIGDTEITKRGSKLPILRETICSGTDISNIYLPTN